MVRPSILLCIEVDILIIAQVPWDAPRTTHDMLLRFMNTDFLSAAGGAAKIPSRVGEEQEAIVGETHPNGTSLHGGPDDAAALAAIDKAGGSEPGTGAEAVRQAYYNAGSAALLVLLVLACAAIFLYLRARTRREAKDGGGGGGGYAMQDSARRHRRSDSSRRTTTAGRRGHRKGALSLASSASEGPHELDELVVERPEEEEEDDDRTPRYEPRREARSRNEELFSVCVRSPALGYRSTIYSSYSGEDDEEEEVVGDLGRVDERDEKGRLVPS